MGLQTMIDFLSQEERSALMSRIRAKDTAPERYVRKAVWGAGFRYRLHVRSLPGTPDLVLRRYRTVTLVQGCFWHGHDCPKGRRRPKTNTEFWRRKIVGNVSRDMTNQAKLKEMGWTVILVWECNLHEDTHTLVAHLMRIKGMLNNV